MYVLISTGNGKEVSFIVAARSPESTLVPVMVAKKVQPIGRNLSGGCIMVMIFNIHHNFPFKGKSNMSILISTLYTRRAIDQNYPAASPGQIIKGNACSAIAVIASLENFRTREEQHA